MQAGRGWTDFEGLWRRGNCSGFNGSWRRPGWRTCDGSFRSRRHRCTGRSPWATRIVPTPPVSPYGVTKLAAEKLLLAHVGRHGLPRSDPALLLDLRAPSATGHGVQHLHRGADRGPPDRRVRRRPPVAVEHVHQRCVDATVQRDEHAEVGGHLQHRRWGRDRAPRCNRTDRRRAEGRAADSIQEAARPGDERRTFADISRAREALGYVPQVAPAQGLRAQVKWQAGLRSGATSGS